MQKFTELPEDIIKYIISLTSNKVFDLTCVCKYFNDNVFTVRLREITPNQFPKMKDKHLLKLKSGNFTSLNLWNNKSITDESLGKLINLTYLDLTYNNSITDKALGKLVTLASLNLSCNKSITDESLGKLIN